MKNHEPLTFPWAYQLLVHVDRYFQGGYLTTDGLVKLKATVHQAVLDGSPKEGDCVELDTHAKNPINWPPHQGGAACNQRFNRPQIFQACFFNGKRSGGLSVLGWAPW